MAVGKLGARGGFGSAGAIGRASSSTASPPSNTVAPVASGNKQVGQTLSTTNGTWTNTPTGYAYQWKRGGSNISAATSSTYVLVEADAGQAITCSVTASNAGGSNSATSNSLLIDVYIVYLTNIVDATDATTYSGGVWNSVSFGVAAANRKIVAGISTRNASSPSISSLNFAGITSFTASIAKLTSDSAQNVAYMIALDMPSGTSGNISLTWSAATTRMAMGLWAVYGAEGSAPSDFRVTAVDNDPVNIFAENGSVVIGYSFINSNTPSWTGITQDFAGAVESTLNHGGGHASFASGIHSTTTFKVDWTGTLAPVTMFAAFSPAQTATTDVSTDIVVSDGVRTWFNTPSTILVGSDIYAGGVSTAGDIVVGKQGASPSVLAAVFQNDDHDNPALLKRSSDNKILAAYCNHNGSNSYFIHVSTNANDASAFGSASDVGSSMGTDKWGYANLVEVTDGIFNFVRSLDGGGNWRLMYSKSTDNGATWASAVTWFGPSASRPYIQITKNGANRFEIFTGDANPGEGSTGIYHFYYDAGTWRKSDGTSIGSPPFTTSQFTQIWDKTTAKAWAWDAKAYAGNPAIVYATFQDILNHQYRYAKWNGSAWVDNFVCNGGSTIYASAGSEDYYSGGICLDPDDANTIYCSRRVAGVHQLFKGVTADGGATWTMTQLTFGSVKRFRPQKLGSVSAVTYLAGTYTDYTTYSTAIRKIAV